MYYIVCIRWPLAIAIKQLLDEVEHDIMNYQNLVSVLSASAFGFGR